MDIGKPERVIEVEPAVNPFEGDEISEPVPRRRESEPTPEREHERERELVPAKED